MNVSSMSDHMNEHKIERLMDFLRFRGDGRLARLAAEAEARHPAGVRTLADDDLDALFAAGDGAWNAPQEKEKDDER